jgi:hypothetical protein
MQHRSSSTNFPADFARAIGRAWLRAYRGPGHVKFAGTNNIVTPGPHCEAVGCAAALKN